MRGFRRNPGYQVANPLAGLAALRGLAGAYGALGSGATRDVVRSPYPAAQVRA